VNRIARQFLEAAASDPSASPADRAIAAAMLPSRPAAAGARATSRRTLRARVLRRDRVCQAGTALGAHSGKLEWDHQWGRGAEPETERNTRMICGGHHLRKTDNEPSRLAWILDWRRWAAMRGFTEEVEHADRAAALERAQHPEGTP
jgi:hypothetical protein